MATVNKDFKIKQGLVVEGTSATVNGNQVLSEHASDEYILNLIGGETAIGSVDDNFVIDGDKKLHLNGSIYNSNGLVIGHSGGFDITFNDGDGDTYINQTTGNGVVHVLGELTVDYPNGTNDPAYSAFNVDPGAAITDVRNKLQVNSDNQYNSVVINGNESSIALNNADNDNRVLTINTDYNEAHLTAPNGSLFLTSDNNDVVLNANGSVYVNTNQINATNNNTEMLLRKTEYWQNGNQYGIVTNNGSTFKQVATQGDFSIEANNGNVDIYGQNDVNIWTNNGNIVLNPDGNAYIGNTNGGQKIATRGEVDYLIGDNTVDGSTGNTVKDRIDTAIANVVNSAPATLDTLKELADALQDNPDIISNLQDVAAGKQDTLTTGDGIDISSNVISVVTDASGGVTHSSQGIGIKRAVVDGWYDASGAAATAESNANSYTDTAIGNIPSALITSVTSDFTVSNGELQLTDSYLVTLDGEQTLTNKELVDPLLKGELKLEDSNGTFEALISLSSNELVLDTDSRNIILSPEGGNVYVQNSNSTDNIVVTQGTLNNAINGANITPNSVQINNYRKEEGTQQSVGNASTVNVHMFAYPYESVKYLVRVVGWSGGTKHSQMTEILVTVDGNNNIAMTEYGTICTNADNLATFSAFFDNVAQAFYLTATTAVNNCEIITAATMLSWAD